MNSENGNTKVSVDYDNWPLAIVLVLIFFYGKPDLLDALIHYFMQAKP